MDQTQGNLWDWHDRGHTIVISTNIGHSTTAPYCNNMGAGIAYQAAQRFPELPSWYGQQCMRHGEDTPVLGREDLGLLCFPVKPYRAEDPERGWAQDASLPLIEDRLAQLAEICLNGAPVALSTVGAGPKGSGGGLDPRVVEDAVRRHLGHLDDVTLVEYRRD